MTIPLTPELRQALIAAAHTGKLNAAREAGIDLSTLKRWLKRQEPEFVSLRIAFGKAQAKDARKLIAKAKKRDPVKMLSVIHGIREPQTRKMELTGRGGGPIEIATKYTDAEIEAELERRNLVLRRPVDAVPALLVDGDEGENDDA